MGPRRNTPFLYVALIALGGCNAGLDGGEGSALPTARAIPYDAGASPAPDDAGGPPEFYPLDTWTPPEPEDTQPPDLGTPDTGVPDVTPDLPPPDVGVPDLNRIDQRCRSAAERAVFEEIPFMMEPVGAGHTAHSLGDDRVTDRIPLEFEVEFYGRRYSDLLISSNGFVSFENADGDSYFSSECCWAEDLPAEYVDQTMAAVWWVDIHPGRGGTIRSWTAGVSPRRRFVVEFRDIPHYSNSENPVTAQIVLHEGSNAIDFVCDDCDTDGRLHTQGVQDLTATYGLVSHFAEDSLTRRSRRFWTCAP